MLRYLIPCLLLSVGLALGAGDEASGENAVEKKDPPNEWGTYYNLPAEIPDMTVLFLEVYNDYVDKASSEFKCRENDADFSRWYKSSKDSDLFLLSFYCRTKEVRGYEHLKVSKSKKNVVQYDSSLKTFGIMDAGEYNDKLPEAEGKTLKEQLLANVTDDIAKQVSDTGSKDEICPDPGTDTFYSAETKKENGLYYYRFAISCNVTHMQGYSSHMTDIEVVVDKDFKALNDGKAVLASMEQPTRNTQFIREKKEEEALKQKDAGARMMVSIVTIMLVPVFRLLF